MTDFFADLEAELLGAARRRAAPASAPARRGRRRRSIAPALALAAALAAVILVAVIALPRDGGMADEVPAVPPTASGGALTPSLLLAHPFLRPAACDPPNTVERQASPSDVTAMLGVLRRPAGAADGLANLEALPVAALDPGDASRLAGTSGPAASVHVLPSAAVRPDPPCFGDAPERTAGGGACLVLAEGDLARSGRCFTTREIRTGRAIAVTPRGVRLGLVPDGIRRVRVESPLGSEVVGVTDNVYEQGSGGARAGQRLRVTMFEGRAAEPVFAADTRIVVRGGTDGERRRLVAKLRDVNYTRVRAGAGLSRSPGADRILYAPGAYRAAERLGTFLRIERYEPAELPADVVVELDRTR